MKQKDIRILQKRKRKLAKRLERKQYPDRPRPMFTARNIHYEMADRIQAVDCGGLGAFHLLAHNSGLIKAIDTRVHLLKQHKPYHESDHVMNIAYNTLTGGMCLDDLELRRNDETYMDALGAERIPDPTTAGDFTRRFSVYDIVELMEAANSIRPGIWNKRLSKQDRRLAIVDVDGTIAPTWGECKEDMGLSYKGQWGYHPLVVSLANTMEPLYLVNRPGNRVSHDGATPWIDRAIALVRESFEQVCVRGDTDFALTANFDRWTDKGVLFAFGIDAMPNLVKIADGLEKSCWKVLPRQKKQPAQSMPRRRPCNVKEDIVVAKKYRNIILRDEQVAQFFYQPTKCNRHYRVIALRKNLAVKEGQLSLWDDIRYFFYITNVEDMSMSEVVLFCHERCNQENLIQQLKNGVSALRMPVDALESNWAYMVMASLAWTLKAWFALLVRKADQRYTLLRMEFRGFLNGLVRIPIQIVSAGRKILYRVLGYNQWTAQFLSTFADIRRLRLA